jgi:hypothetical protein
MLLVVPVKPSTFIAIEAVSRACFAMNRLLSMFMDNISLKTMLAALSAVEDHHRFVAV